MVSLDLADDLPYLLTVPWTVKEKLLALEEGFGTSLSHSYDCILAHGQVKDVDIPVEGILLQQI